MNVHGLPHCDTVKKARAWLGAQGIAYTFVDFRKAPPAPDALARWCGALGWEQVLNRRGTTWRALDAAQQAAVVDAVTAIAVMQARPAVIRRPVVEHGTVLLVGFDAATWARLLR